MIRTFTIALILLLIHASPAISGGFQINQQGHKATGLGGAFAAYSLMDASAAFYNPGGMYRLSGHNFTGGMTFLSPHVSLQTQVHDNIDQTTGISTPIQFYYVGQAFLEDLRIGLSVNNQFGSRSSFMDNWEGRNIVQDISLKTYMFQPTVSYSYKDKVGFGAGFVYALGTFDYQKAVPVGSSGSQEGQANLTGSGQAMGFNAGIHASPITLEVMGGELTPSIGATYRSSLNMELSDGTATFTDIPYSLRDKFPKETSFTSGIDLPAVASGGLSVRYERPESFSVEVLYDLNYTMWSSYDSLKFEFENEETPTTKIPKQWEDVMTHRIGLEIGYKNTLFLRGGIYIDNTPIPDGYVSPELPDNDHIGYTAGIGLKFNNQISVDLSYLRSEFERMNASMESAGFAADYRRIVNVYGIGVNISLAGKTTDTDTEE